MILAILCLILVLFFVVIPEGVLLGLILAIPMTSMLFALEDYEISSGRKSLLHQVLYFSFLRLGDVFH